MKELKLGDKMCFINLIFKSGCVDSIAVSGNPERLSEKLNKELYKKGGFGKNNFLTFKGINGSGYVDLSTVAKIEISDKDKGPLVLVNSQLNTEIDKKGKIRWKKLI